MKLENKGKTKFHIGPATIEGVQAALSLFKKLACLKPNPSLAAARMWLLTLLCKHKGCRASDLLKLSWSQIKIGDGEISFTPKFFKNSRCTNRWLFSIRLMDGLDNLLDALKVVKNLSIKVGGNDKIFGLWTTGNINYYYTKFQKEIGEKLSAHRIRVLTCLCLTSLGWRDSSIKSFMHWKADDSLETYRAGFETAELRKEKDLFLAYSAGFEGKSIANRVRSWKGKFE